VAGRPGGDGMKPKMGSAARAGKIATECLPRCARFAPARQHPVNHVDLMRLRKPAVNQAS
jgi:hypothetical protein